MIALVIMSLLASGPGARLSAGSVARHAHLTSSNAPAVAGRTLSSFVSTYDGQAVGLNWTQVVAGIDGVGQGNDVFRVAILVGVDEVSVCHIDVACDASVADYVATCTPAAFVVGDDIDVRITSMPCLGAPSGFQTTDLLQH